MKCSLYCFCIDGVAIFYDHHLSIQEVDLEKRRFRLLVLRGARLCRFMEVGDITGKSERNEELCFKMAGPVVRQVLERLARQRHKLSPWSGS